MPTVSGMPRPFKLSALLSQLCLALVLSLTVFGAADAADRKKPPPSKRTQVITPKVFEKLNAAQEAADADDYQTSLKILDGLKAKKDDLNSYEHAMLWNFYASVYYGLEDIPKTLNAYQQVLKHEDLPEGLRNSSLFAVAQLNLMTGKYSEALRVLNEWLAVVEVPSPDALILKAQALYQLERYGEAERPIMQALGMARDKQQNPKESWLSLLLAVYFEQNEITQSTKVLELLVALYPKASYYRQLSGMYGLQDRQIDQTAVLRAAYEAGLIDSEPQLLNLARLYLANEAPYPAIKVLREGLDKGIIKSDEDSLQLYAQALAFGQEHEAQIPVLEKLVKLTGDGDHAIYLGQALSELGRWEEAAAAFKKATKDPDLARPGQAWLSVGSALFNAGKLDEAAKAFQQAAKIEKTEDTAKNWLKFVASEKQRLAALEQ